MPRPRVPLGLEATRATLNRAACAEIGRLLAESRADRKLSVPEVARCLMLSPAQVLALETVQPEAFYGADFYANALRKYAAFLEVPADTARVLIGPSADDAPHPFRRSHPATVAEVSRATSARRPAPAAVAASAVLAALVIAGGWWWLAGGKTPDSAPMAGPDAGSAPGAAEGPPAPAVVPAPPAPVAEPGLGYRNEAEAAVAAVADQLSPALSAAEPGRADNTRDARWGSVTVAQATWVFVRYADNSTEDQSLAPNTAFIFRAQPVYLVVGAAEGTRVTVGGHTIDPTPFVVNGQLRIGKSFLGTFVAAR